MTIESRFVKRRNCVGAPVCAYSAGTKADAPASHRRRTSGQALSLPQAGLLINRAGVASPVRGNKLNELLTLVNETEWRYPDRPTVQMVLPYCFIADELVYLSQIGTFAHYRKDPLPGTIFGGRFPLNVWPRPLMWAFEWHDIEKDLILKRGEPLFYCQFEAEGPDRPVQVVEAERTPELQKYMEQIGGVVNYVNQTFGLFKAAEALRPKTLLRPKTKD